MLTQNRLYPIMFVFQYLSYLVGKLLEKLMWVHSKNNKQYIAG